MQHKSDQIQIECQHKANMRAKHTSEPQFFLINASQGRAAKPQGSSFAVTAAKQIPSPGSWRKPGNPTNTKS